MLEAGAVEPRKKIRRYGILKMPESPSYPLLEPGRIIAACQHLRIVIAFQHKCVAAAKGCLDVRRRTTGISQHAQSAHPVAEYELGRLVGIMGNRIRLDLDIIDRETLVSADDIDLRQQPERSFDTAQGAMRQPYGDTESVREPGNAGNVVAMLVRYHDCIDCAGFETEPGQAGQSFLESKAAIEQHARIRHLDYQAVPLRAAT